MSMIEVVARAICKSRTCEGYACCQWPAQGGRTDCPVSRGNYNDAANAAIAALRVPNEAMILASAKAAVDQLYFKADAWDRGYCQGQEQDWLNGAKFGYMAAVDAALAEPTTGE